MAWCEDWYESHSSWPSSRESEAGDWEEWKERGRARLPNPELVLSGPVFGLKAFNESGNSRLEKSPGWEGGLAPLFRYLAVLLKL